MVATIAAAILSFACSQITPPLTSLAPIRPELVEPALRPMSEWTNQELIARLPLAFQRRQFDAKSGRFVVDAVSKEWGRRVAAGSVSQDELGVAVRKSAILRSSPMCFQGKPYHVWMRVPEWLDHHIATATTNVCPKASIHASSTHSTCGTFLAAKDLDESFQAVGLLPLGTTNVSFAVTITEIFDGEKVLWSGTFDLPVQLVPNAEMKPVDSAELAAQVRKASGLVYFADFVGGDASMYFLALSQRPVSGPLASTLMFGEIELLKDGVVVATKLLDDPDEFCGLSGASRPLTFVDENARGDVDREIAIGTDIDRYSIRVHGIPPPKPSRWYRTDYWSGEYTVPLGEVPRLTQESLRPE